LPYEDLPFSTTVYFLAGSFDGGAGLVAPPAGAAAGAAAGAVAAAAAGAAAAGAAAPGITLTFLTPTAPPFRPVVLVHCPLTLNPNICRYPRQLITSFSRSMSFEAAKSRSEVILW
jgi:hypothetical protein